MWLLLSSFAEAVDLKKVPLRPTYGKHKSVTFIVIWIMLALCLRKGFNIPVQNITLDGKMLRIECVTVYSPF